MIFWTVSRSICSSSANIRTVTRWSFSNAACTASTFVSVRLVRGCPVLLSSSTLSCRPETYWTIRKCSNVKDTRPRTPFSSSCTSPPHSFPPWNKIWLRNIVRSVFAWRLFPIHKSQHNHTAHCTWRTLLKLCTFVQQASRFKLPSTVCRSQNLFYFSKRSPETFLSHLVYPESFKILFWNSQKFSPKSQKLLWNFSKCFKNLIFSR